MEVFDWFFLLLLKMSDREMSPEEIGAILDSYPEGGESSAGALLLGHQI